MSKNRPLVLIADDITQYRHNTIPDLLRTMKGVQVDIIEASDLHSTMQQAWLHRPGSDNPLDLIVLDMHMPESRKKADVLSAAGIDVLHKIHAFRDMHLCMPNCPIVIFSGYPSFEDCFRAAQAGASAYITKVTNELPEGKTEGGPEEFVRVCQQLLAQEEGAERRGKLTALSDEWLKINNVWLRRAFGGKWASFVFKEVAEKASLTDRAKYPERDGVVVLSGGTYEEVQALVLSDPILYQDVPPVIKVSALEQTGEEVRL